MVCGVTESGEWMFCLVKIVGEFDFNCVLVSGYTPTIISDFE